MSCVLAGVPPLPGGCLRASCPPQKAQTNRAVSRDRECRPILQGKNQDLHSTGLWGRAPCSAAQVTCLRQHFRTGNSTLHSGTIKSVLHFSTLLSFLLLFQLGSSFCLFYSQTVGMKCYSISNYLHNPCINFPLEFLLKDITKKISQCCVASEQLLHCIVLRLQNMWGVSFQYFWESHIQSEVKKKAINGVIITDCVPVSTLPITVLLTSVRLQI